MDTSVEHIACKKKIAPNCLLSYHWQTLFSVDGPNQPMDLTQDCFQPSVIFFQDCNSPSHLVPVKPQSPISLSLLCKVISFLFDLHCISESSSKAPRSGSSSTFPTTSSSNNTPPPATRQVSTPCVDSLLRIHSRPCPLFLLIPQLHPCFRQSPRPIQDLHSKFNHNHP